ncbi:MAG: tetratricopeptide repeat protein [Promethearchaeota archaeon]
MIETSSIVDYLFQNGYINTKNSYNYLELFHNLVIELINKEKYEKLVTLCYEVFQFDQNITLIPKIIFTLINLHVNQSAIDLCELYLRFDPNDEIFYDVINEFLKYENYSGAIDLCRMYIKVNPKGNLGFIRTIIVGSLKNGKEYSKILNLIEELLETHHGFKYIYTIIHWMIEIQNYKAVIDISKLILESSSQNKILILKIIGLLIDNGKLRGALDLCIILLKLYPSSIDVLILFGTIFTRMGQYQQALDIFDSALSLFPSTNTKIKGKLLNFIGWTYLKRKDLKKATNLCIKSMKLNPKFPNSYNNLGFVYYKKGYIEKGIKLIKRALSLNSNFCQAWVNLGQIHLEMKNYYDSFTACYNCLSINNQHQEGIDLYKKLRDNPDLKILSYLIPRMIHLGYRCGFDYLNEDVFPNKLLRNQRYIKYSQEFLNFLKRIRLAQMYLNDFVSIYCWLPKCTSCHNLLRLYGERINYKNGSKTKMYRCEKCGKEKREIRDMKSEDIPYLKIRVVIKSSLSNCEGEALFYSKLDYERIFITYSVLEIIQNKTKFNSSELFNNLENAVLLCGKDIRKTCHTSLVQ